MIKTNTDPNIELTSGNNNIPHNFDLYTYHKKKGNGTGLIFSFHNHFYFFIISAAAADHFQNREKLPIRRYDHRRKIWI